MIRNSGRHLLPLPSAQQWQALDKLSRKEKLVFVTHRYERETYDIGQITCDWLRKHGISNPVVYFTQNQKSELIGKLKVELFVDDRHENCRDVAENTEALVLMPHRSYNQSFQPSSSATNSRLGSTLCLHRMMSIRFRQPVITTASLPMASLENKIALITGGGGGIGGAIARRLAREGAKIAVADIDEESAKSRAAEIAGQGYEAIPILADVRNKDSVQQMVQTTLSRWGKLDILVNVAGGAQIQTGCRHRRIGLGPDH